MAVQCFLCRLIDPERELVEMGCPAEAVLKFIPDIGSITVKVRGLNPPEIKLVLAQAAAAGAAVLPFSFHGAGLFLSGARGTLKGLAQTLSASPELQATATALDIITRNAYRKPGGELHLGSDRLSLGERTLVMGILNLTPDSFSDGGRFPGVDAAVTWAREMAAAGADIIDIGGESTRPGNRPVPAEEELHRVLPVIRALQNSPDFNTPLSIDTYKVSVAKAALDLGATLVNDVWGFKKEPALAKLVARYGVPVCLMHNQDNTVYNDLLPDIMTSLQESVNLALAAGIRPDQVLIDPGIGFGKNLSQNLEVMQRLDDFTGLGHPILLGTSRKSMIGKTLHLPEGDRIEGTAATVALGIAAGAAVVRVHDVREMIRVVRMTDAIVRR